MNYIITLSATLAILAASSDQIPKIVYQIRLAQLKILKEMQIWIGPHLNRQFVS